MRWVCYTACMRRAAIFVFCLLVLAPTSFALAQSDLPNQIVPCDGVGCGFCDLVELAQRLINTGIFITIVFSATLFAYAGILYLSSGGDAGKAGKARGIFAHVAGGIIIILCAWLGVDTLMRTMVGAEFGPWNSIGCSQTAGFTR